MNLLSKSYNILTNKFYFKLLYLLVSFSFTNILVLIPGINILNKLLIVWGLLLAFINIFNFIKSRRRLLIFEIFIYTFLVLTLFITIIKYPTLENIKVWLINLIILTVIFSIDTKCKTHKLKKEINLISHFYVTLTFIFSLVSSIMIIFEKTIQFTNIVDGVEIVTSYTGLFQNENSLGIAAGLSFVLGIYLFFNTNLNGARYLLAFNTILQLVTLFLSNGRSAYLVLLSLIFVFMYVYINNNLFRVGIIIGPIVLFFTWISFNTDKIYSILSGREALWGTSFILIKKYPLFGIGNTNLIPMMEENKIDYLRGLEFGGLHNIFLQITTVNGIIATSLILLFVISLFLFLVKKIEAKHEIDKIKYTSILGLLVGIIMINCMESNLIYIISFISLLFWIYSGYMVSILTNHNKL